MFFLFQLDEKLDYSSFLDKKKFLEKILFYSDLLTFVCKLQLKEMNQQKNNLLYNNLQKNEQRAKDVQQRQNSSNKQQDIKKLIFESNVQLFSNKFYDQVIKRFQASIQKKLQQKIQPLKEQIISLHNTFQQNSNFQSIEQSINNLKSLFLQIRVKIDFMDNKLQQNKNSIKIKKVTHTNPEKILQEQRFSKLTKIQEEPSFNQQQKDQLIKSKIKSQVNLSYHNVKGPLQEIMSVSQILTQHQHGNQLFNNLNIALKERLIQLGKHHLKKMFQFPILNIDRSVNKTPYFHDVIDKHYNILLLIKLKISKTVLAAFTAIPFVKRNIPEPNPDAFIANLSKNKFYKPKNRCKTICYDQNQLIFGNSEIALKVKQEKLYSNFGILKAYFDNKDDDLDAFVQGDQNKIEKHQKMVEKVEQQKIVQGIKRSKRFFDLQKYQIFQIVES